MCPVTVGSGLPPCCGESCCIVLAGRRHDDCWRQHQTRSKLEALIASIEHQEPLVAVVQDALTGEILWLGFLHADAPRQIVESGELSIPDLDGGMPLATRHVTRTPDGLGLVVLVEGPGSRSQLDSFLPPEPRSTPSRIPAELAQLEWVLQARKSQDPGLSYTRALLDAGIERIGEKIREEAAELCEALQNETPSRISSEAADLFYHVLVGLVAKEVPLRSVVEILASRSGMSGLVEKAQRPKSSKPQ